ncbi:MAG: hypothetical protein AN484_09600 [Aphanizomenon flos-aquae WA102]|uniref:Uncharacterized protein n=1 Tax=Aphanizomenon flos-aquae WA102 TaxID=1710896 RepID=A0A1B7X3R2_APHFL|nr:MAG: hypothetical protein AN484_09600 [Aphanizomenon flos-aquae WA102]
MAVEESIKIKIQANAEEFKIVAGIINTELGKLGKNFEILEGNIKQTSNAMNSFDGSSKKFNKGLMSISLILQDLPYGFRGIQNNIPALVQGFGVLYLAISAVTAAMTYFVLEGDNMSKGTKKLYDTFKDFINGVVNDLYNALAPAFESVVKSVMILWDMFGSYLTSIFKDTWDILVKIITVVGNNIAYMFKAFTAILKGDWKTLGETLVNYWKSAWNLIIDILSYSLKTVGNLVGGLVGIFDKDFGKLISKSTEYTANKFADNFKFAFKEVEKASKKIDIFSIFGGKKKKGGEDNKTFKADKSNLEVLKAQENFYKDDLFMRRYYALEVLKEEEKLALMEANFNKANKVTLTNIAEEFRIKRLAVEKSTLDGIQAIRNDAADRTTKFNKDELEKAEKIQKELTDRSIYFTDQRIKAAQTEADASIRANRGNYQAQKQALEDVIVKLGIFRMAGIGGAEAMLKLDEAIANNKAKIEGLVDPLETLNQALTSAFGQLNVDMVTGFAENIGEMLAGGKFDFSKLGNILADGLSSIGKALIAFALTNGAVIELFKDPKTWPIALAAGVAAVAAGSFLKSKLSDNKATAFANGGIVSGPTMGLVGEYPGAANNPEVIAPLDKLKSMIGGGGGGMFVLRGQDLLLSVNRAQKASNLKGQNISLA